MRDRLEKLQQLLEIIRRKEEARLGSILQQRALLEKEIKQYRSALPDPDPTQGFTRVGGWERARLWKDTQIIRCNQELAQVRAAQAEQIPKTAKARARCEVFDKQTSKNL